MSDAPLNYTTTASDDGAGALFDSLAGKIEGLGKLAGGLALGGVAALGAGLVGVGTAAVGFASEANQAVNDLESGLGLTRDQAEALGQVGLDIYANNWGNSLDEVNQAVIAVQQQFAGLGGIGEDETSKLVAGAFALRDSFGGETTEYLGAARTLMEQFGLSGQQALDFITSGYQSGLNASDDFLDSIGEYSTQLANGGASADQFFSLMETGLGSGVLGTDKAADSFKEFTLRIADGSSSTADALKGIGLNANQVAKDLASGELTKADVFQTVIEKLRGMDDAVARDQIGVALLGTQYEDLGLGAALNIDLANTKLSDLAGSTDSLNAKYQNFGSLFEGFKRTALVALEPIGAKVLGLANEAMPALQQGMAWLGDQLPVWMDAAGQAVDWFISGWQQLQPVLAPVVAIVGELAGHLADLLTGNGFEDTIPSILEGLGQLGTMAQSAFEPLITAAAQWVLDALPGLLANLGTFEQSLISAAMTYIPPWAAALVQFGLTAVQWVVDALPGLVSNLASFASAMLGWVLEQLPTWGAQLGQFAGAIVGWVLDALPGLAANLGQAAGVLLGWVISTAGELVPQLLVLAGKFIGWIGETVIPALPGALLTIAQALWNFVSGLVQEAGPHLIEVAKKFYGWVSETVIPALPGALDAIKTAISGWVSGALGWVASQAASIGSNIIEGVKSGIASGVESLKGAITQAANDALAAAKNALGIHSPSKKFADEVGAQIPAGMAQGIHDGGDAVDAALADKLAGLAKQVGDGLNSLATGLGAVNAVELPVREKLTEVAFALRDAVADFWHAGQTVLYALKDDVAPKFADLASKATSALGNVEAFSKLADFERPAREQLIAFSEALRDLVADFWHRAQEVLYGLQDDVAPRFADLASKAVSTIGAALDAFANLADYEGVAPDRMQALGDDIERASAMLLTIALRANTDGLANASSFAQAMSAVFDLFRTGVEAMDALRDYQMVPSERMTAVLADFDAALRLMVQVTRGADQEGVTIAAAFATAARSIFDLFKSGTDALDGLRSYEGVPPDRFGAFEADFLTAIATMARLVSAAGGMLLDAETWRDQMQDVAAAIKAGMDAIGSLDGLNVSISASVSASAGADVPAFADGTTFAPGGLALVGEEGPELVTLPRGSRVDTAGDTQRLLGGGSVVINQTFNIRGSVSDADMRRMMQIAREEALKVARETGSRADIKQRVRRTS